jgi:cytochrome P450
MKPPPFDLVDPAVQQDPFDSYAALRDTGSIHLLDPDAPSPTYVVSGYEAARAVLGDPLMFSSRLLPLPVMLFLDPPDHDRIRRTVARAFTPKAVSALEPRIDAIATELIDAFVTASGGDLVTGVSGRLPVYVIGEVLGVPTDDWEQLRAWSEATVRALAGQAGSDGADTSAALEGAIALHGYLDGVVERYHAEPSDTIAGQLAAFEQAGELDRAELVGFLQLMFVAGHETTAALLAHIVELFATDEALFARVRADVDLVPALVEEALRTHGPLQRLFRIATADAVVDGVEVPAGSTLVVLIGSASRDEARFRAGDRFDLDAADAAHLAFGHGIHHCLGAPLARLEARVAVTRFVRAVGSVALLPDRPPTRFSGGTTSELQTTSLWVAVTPSGGPAQ